MLISLSKRFVFISNSKTASTSFEKVLDKYAEIREPSLGRKHMLWSETRRAYDFLFDHPDHRPESFFRFGVVRDPVHWFVSWYNYRLGSKGNSPLPAGTSFEAFWNMNDWVKFREGVGKHLQKDHFVDDDGVCRFDLVMPMDMLQDYETRLFARLGVEESLPVVNRSRTEMRVEDIAPALYAEIREFWEEDYAFIEQMRARVRTVLCAVTARLHPVAEDILPHVRVHVPANVLAGAKFELGGAVVTGEGVPAEARLTLRSGSTETPVAWGIASLGIGKRFPGNPRALQARFQVKDFVVRPGEQVELMLEIPGEAPRAIASLAAVPPDVVATTPAG